MNCKHFINIGLLFVPFIINGQVALQNVKLQNAKIAQTAVSGGGDINTGLGAHWKWDDNTGNTVTDSTGFGHNGTRNGVGGWGTPKIGVASGSFYGGSGGNGMSFTAIAIPAVFSYAVWMYPSNLVNNFQNFIAEGSAKGVWFDGSDNKINYFVGSNHKFAAVIPTNGVWTHVCITCDGTTAKLYTNGVNDGSTLTGFTFTFNASGIGADGGTGGEGYSGLYDDGCLYTNRCLQPIDVTALYNSTVGPVP